MQMIPPVQMDRMYAFRWFGVEAARNAQQMQQQIAGINVIMKIPAPLYKGYTLDLGPVLSQMVENLFGPRLAPLTFRDARMELSVDPMQENEMLQEGFVVPVHKMDDHMAHMQAHKQALLPVPCQSCSPELSFISLDGPPPHVPPIGQPYTNFHASCYVV